MTTLLIVGNGEGSRRCDAKCHEATEPDYDCCCGGRYHGLGTQTAREFIHADVLTGRFGAGAAELAAQLTPEALQEPPVLSANGPEAGTTPTNPLCTPDERSTTVMTTFTISGAELHSAAAWVARFSPTRPTIPILGNVLVDAADDVVRLTASDFELTGTVTTPAEVNTPGRVLVSARLLAAIAKTLPRNGTVELRAGGAEMRVACGASRWTLPAAEADDYPPLPTPGEPVAEAGADDLTRALARVLPAAARDPRLPALRGVCLREDAEGLLTLAATDRYRLAVAPVPWQPTVDGGLGELVAPAELFDALRRVIPPGGAPVRMHATDNTLSVATTGHTVTGRRIAEAFPNYRMLLDGHPTVGTATVAVAELAQAAERAATVAAEDNQPLRLDFDTERVRLSAAADGYGHTEHSAPLLGYEGEPVAAGFNARYLQDALACLDAPTAVLSLRGGTRPMLLRPAGADGNGPDGGYVHLVCPMRLTDTGATRPSAA